MKILKDIPYLEESEAQALDVYLPDTDPSSVFVYFHGGGLSHGDKRSAERFAAYLTARGVAVVSANYRMYPDAKYPDFIYDSAAAVKWTKENLGRDLTDGKIFVGGSSAGGYLSMMLCFDEKYLASVGLSSSDIAGYFHDAGQPTAHFRVLTEREIDDRRIIVDESAPLYHVEADKNYPRMRFIVSDNDMQNRFEQTMLMLSTLKHFGYENYDSVVMKDSKHCSYCGKTDEDGESLFGKMIYDFVK